MRWRVGRRVIGIPAPDISSVVTSGCGGGLLWSIGAGGHHE